MVLLAIQSTHLGTFMKEIVINRVVIRFEARYVQSKLNLIQANG